MLRVPFTASSRLRLARSLMSSATSESLLPRRHSRHGPPPTCTSKAQLQELTQELLESKPGSLFTYSFRPSSGVNDDSAYAWDAADAAVQKTEYVIRGHAAQIPDTLCWNEHLRGRSKNASDSSASPESCIETIMQLIDRLDQEGQMYMELRREVKHTRGLTVVDERDEAESTSGGQADDMDQKENAQTLENFAAPGPTVSMYDTLLDSMAITTSPQTPKAVGTVLETIMDRYCQDGGNVDGCNVNISTVPTILTFNAVLRAIASTPYEGNQERTRDDAVFYAFATYDGMREVVPRNSATYTYMLQIVAKYFPTSRTRGNIAHTLWMQARKERVVNDGVIHALELANEPSNGREFDEWMEKYMKDEGETVKDVPLKFRRNEKIRRFDKQHATY